MFGINGIVLITAFGSFNATTLIDAEINDYGTFLHDFHHVFRNVNVDLYRSCELLQLEHRLILVRFLLLWDEKPRYEDEHRHCFADGEVVERIDQILLQMHRVPLPLLQHIQQQSRLQE